MAASLFMDVMDGTIVTTALPKMAQTFNVSAATASLLVSTYMIAVDVVGHLVLFLCKIIFSIIMKTGNAFTR